MAKKNVHALRIIGADDDIPRVLLAAGSCPDPKGRPGFFVYAQRPSDKTALLLHQVKNEPPMIWQTDLGLGPSHPPELVTTVEEAVKARKAAIVAPPAGPATMKGRWTGTIGCTAEGNPIVQLERKVASYGVMRVTSRPDGRWEAKVERAERWFGKAKAESVERSDLASAITAGLGLVVGLVSEACSFRDTRRRNTVDADYAAQHPYKAPKAPKDPTERYKPRPGPSHIAKAGANGQWNVLDAYNSVVAAGYGSQAEAERAAKKLSKGATVADVQPKAPKPAKPETPARAPKGGKAAPSADKPTRAPKVDAAKDAALMAAFSDAIARAAAQARAGAA